MDIAVIATGGDPGHAPARPLYGETGFTLLPIARYFRLLSQTRCAELPGDFPVPAPSVGREAAGTLPPSGPPHACVRCAETARIPE